MKINIKRAPKGLLGDDTPYFEKWSGEGGKTLIMEKLFVITHEDIKEVELLPTYKVGSNYAYTPVEEGVGDSYEASIKNAGFDITKNNFLIVRREFRDWVGQDRTDELTLILIDE